MVPDDLAHGNPEEFPLPFPLGGARPTAGTSAVARAHCAWPGIVVEGPLRHRAFRRRRAETGRPHRVPRIVRPRPAGAAAKPRSATSQTTTTPKKKSVKLDPAILEKLLQRNASRPAGGN